MIIKGRPFDVAAVEFPEPFRVEVRPDRSRVVVIPRGELDIATVDAVTAEIDELAARGFAQIVLDLRCVCFMDSTGVRLVLGQCRRPDVQVTVVDGSPAVSRLFDLTGVRGIVPFEGGA
jgi:anti-anti-sigma factor